MRAKLFIPLLLFPAAGCSTLATPAQAQRLAVVRGSVGTPTPTPIPAVQTAQIGVKTFGGSGCIPTNYTGSGTLSVSGTDASLYKIDTGGGQSCLVPTYSGSYNPASLPSNQPLAGKTLASTSALTLSDGSASGTMTVTYADGFSVAPDGRDDATNDGGQLVEAMYAAHTDLLDNGVSDAIRMKAGAYNQLQTGAASGLPWHYFSDNDVPAVWTGTPGDPSSYPWITIEPEAAGTVTLSTFHIRGLHSVTGGVTDVGHAYFHIKGLNFHFDPSVSPGLDGSSVFALKAYYNSDAIWIDGNDVTTNDADDLCPDGVSPPGCVTDIYGGIQVQTGDRSSATTPTGEGIYITDNTVHGVYDGIDTASGNNVWIIGNDIQRFWGDAIHADKTDNLTVRWNFQHNRRSGGGHGDYSQLPWTSAVTVAYGYIDWLDDVAYVGRGGGDGDGGVDGEDDGNNFLFSNTPSGVSFSRVTYRGNIVISEEANCIGPNALSTADISFNACIRDQSGQDLFSPTDPVFIFYDPDGSNSGVKFQCNVTMTTGFYEFTHGATDPNPTMTVNSVQSNIDLAASDYAAAFAGTLPTSKPTVGMTLAQLQAVLVPKTGGKTNSLNTTSGCYPGPFKYVDYVDRVDSTPTVSP